MPTPTTQPKYAPLAFSRMLYPQAAYASANSVAVSNVKNVRTVVSYTAEETAVKQYDSSLDMPTRVAKFAGAASGSFTGFVNGFFFWTYALALWCGLGDGGGGARARQGSWGY